MQEVNKIKGYRNMVGITQVDMAKKIGMSERTYATKEQNVNKFTVEELKAIVGVFAEYQFTVAIEDLL